MKLTTYKKIKLLLSLMGVPSSLATAYKIVKWGYQKVGLDMLPWLIIYGIAIVSIIGYFYITYREKMEAIANQQKDDKQFHDWLTYHDSNYARQKYASLEEKILDLIDRRLDHRLKILEDNIRSGNIIPKH